MYIKKNTSSAEWRGLPNAALFRRIHGTPQRTAVGSGKVPGIRERPQHPDKARRVDRGPDLGQGVLRSHRSAPDLGVVQEEQLIVGHIQAG